jgi:hypothetical protein
MTVKLHVICPKRIVPIVDYRILMQNFGEMIWNFLTQTVEDNWIVWNKQCLSEIKIQVEIN